jgi:plasmid stability protein
MATLYVENFPDDRYRALKEQARRNGRSVAAEVIDALQSMVPTLAEVEQRRALAERAMRIREQPPLGPGSFASAEEMVREDRER